MNKILEKDKKEFYNKYYKFQFLSENGPLEKAKKYKAIDYSIAEIYINKYISLK